MKLKYAMLLLLLVGAAPATQSASMDDIRKLYDDGKYTDVLRESSRALAMRDDTLRSRGYDRFDLVRLRAESNLRLKQPAPASDGFIAASKEIAKTDPDRACVLRAVSLLVKRSKNNLYVPKKAKSEPIDVLEEESRKRAIVALYEDEAADVAGKLDALKTATALQPIVDAASKLKSLADLEKAAKGNTEETNNRLIKLGDIAHRLILASVQQMSDRVEVIARQANEKYLIQEGNVYRKRGLASNQRNELRDIMGTADKIGSAVTELATALSTEADFFSKCTADATKLHDRALSVMNDEYNGIYSDP